MQKAFDSSSPVRGEVVEMGVRGVKLRGENGELHPIAYSSISSITNVSRPARKPLS